MNDLREYFQSLQIAIEERDEMSSCGFHYHYPLVEIMRQINGNGSTRFNPEKLLEHGISPHDFRTAWALGFAKETIDYYDNRFTSQVLVARCDTCLKNEGPYDFGRLLPDDIKVALEAKRNKNVIPPTAAKMQLHIA